jgi:hypothetical protein
VSGGPWAGDGTSKAVLLRSQSDQLHSSWRDCCHSKPALIPASVHCCTEGTTIVCFISPWGAHLTSVHLDRWEVQLCLNLMSASSWLKVFSWVSPRLLSCLSVLRALFLELGVKLIQLLNQSCGVNLLMDLFLCCCWVGGFSYRG